MTYLFGDSTPSKLQTNFLELLRHSLDMAVQILRADQRMAEGRERRTAREQRGARELEGLDELSKTVNGVLENVISADATPVSRCAAAIAKAGAEALRAEREAVKASLAADLAATDAEGVRERQSCVRALETLLLRHDLPDAVTSIHLYGDGMRYHGTLSLETPYGVKAALELEVPAASPFAHDLRVERLIEGLEIHAPESAGVFRKQVRMTPQKLGKHVVVDLLVSSGGTKLALRESHEKGAPGFDLTMGVAEGVLGVTRVTKEGDTPIYETTDAEKARLFELDEKLRAAANELARGTRKSVSEASFDGEPLADHGYPTVLVERLIFAMAPTVQEIAKRSLTSTELVLKRALADDRREEIFVSKAELRQKLEPLNDEQRALFAPLGIVEGAVTIKPITSDMVTAAAGSVSPVQLPGVPPVSPPRRLMTSEIDDADIIVEGLEPTPSPAGE
jgi:hypothetical protein